MKKRVLIVAVLLLLAVTVFMFAALPWGNMGWTGANAQYSESCKSTFQGRSVTGEFVLYSDSALTNKVLTLKSGTRTKMLICDETFAQTQLTYLKVTFAGKILYSSPVGIEIVGRGLRDSQS